MLAELAMTFIASAVISGGLIVVLRPLLIRYALARPNARSSHKIPTPQGGGIAVIGATLSVTAAVLLGFSGNENLGALWIVSTAAIIMAAVGAADDIVTVPVIPRLAIQFVLVGAAVATLPTDYRIVDTLPWWLERALWVVAGVWFVNLVNFMDGLDWMTVAEVVPVTGGLVILGYASGMPREAIVLAAAMGGAVAGFAPFNRPVAKLFLGDVGSLPIGLLLAWLLALLASRGHLTAAILLPLYYLIDATSTLILRIRRGERVWEGHRSHFYQRATDGGFAVRDVVGMVFVLNLLLGGLAATTVWANSRTMDYIALGTGCALVCCLLALFARGKRLPR